MKNKRGLVLIVAGCLLLLAAGGLTGRNLLEQRRAAESVESVMQQLARTVPEPGSVELAPEQIPDHILAPKMEMPTVNVDGYDYIGYLSIPALGLDLPVMSEWSYPNLKLSPCRYTGSAYTEDMVLCAHNYSHHFGGLKNLKIGDEVYFTDVDGNRFAYTVAELEQLAPDEAKRMRSGDWALSLFTCTVGGRFRVTVRCDAVADAAAPAALPQ